MSSAPASILVAEDEAVPGQAVVSELRAAGHEVRWVRSARDARRELGERPPRLLVLDLTLETDGLELLQALRFSPQEPAAGIVVLSDRQDAPGRERALQLGAAAIVDKPVAEGSVAPVVAQLLSYV